MYVLSLTSLFPPQFGTPSTSMSERPIMQLYDMSRHVFTSYNFRRIKRFYSVHDFYSRFKTFYRRACSPPSEIFFEYKLSVTSCLQGSGCGSVGRPVASETRGRQFESRHRKCYLINISIYCQLLKRRNKQKSGHEWPILIYLSLTLFFVFL